MPASLPWGTAWWANRCRPSTSVPRISGPRGLISAWNCASKKLRVYEKGAGGSILLLLFAARAKRLLLEEYGLRQPDRSHIDFRRATDPIGEGQGAGVQPEVRHIVVGS